MDYKRIHEGLRGVAFTIPTPFSEEGTTVRYDKVKENVEATQQAGGNVFVPCGDTGEYYSLTDEEWIRMVEATVNATDGDGIVMGGVSGSTEGAKNRIAAYEDVGADAVMVFDPNHTFAREHGLQQHFRELIESTELGVVIYKRGSEITTETLEALSSEENFVGVKYAVNDIAAFARTVSAVSGDLVWIYGKAEQFAPSFAVEGAEGFSTGVGNFASEPTLALMNALREEDWKEAKRLRDAFLPLEVMRDRPGINNSIDAANNVPVIKFGMELAGLYGGPARILIVI